MLVFFDYTCPYSRRLSERPGALTHPALLALGLHEAVIADRGDIDRFRRSVFTAFAQRRVEPEELYGLAQAAGAGVDVAGVDEAAAHWKLTAVAASHEMGRAAGVFGTPTVVTDGGHLGYLKLTDLPADPPARQRLVQVALTAVNDFPELSEIKRPTT